jgi:hypothetical protein
MKKKNGVEKTVQVYGINEYERHLVKLAFHELDESIAKGVRFVNEAHQPRKKAAVLRK